MSASNKSQPLPQNSVTIDANSPGYPPVDFSDKKAAADLDDILNAALDELEDDDLDVGDPNGAGGSGGPNLKGGPDRNRIDKQQEDEQKRKTQGAMNKLIGDLQDPVYGESLQGALQALSGTQEGVDTMEDFVGTQFKEVGGKEGTDVDRTVSKLLSDMSQTGASYEGMEAGQVESMGEDVMNSMMGEFEKMGEKEDYNEVIDGMMRQLLSKELMYDPMKQVCKKYPQWLAEAKAQLTEEDYQRYGTQYQYFQRIVAVYETEPDNYPRLMELMNDIQEYGQPPSEIIKELAPGLEFNEQGMPVMPNMGNSMMPNPGGPGMPMNGGGMPGDAENCSIM